MTAGIRAMGTESPEVTTSRGVVRPSADGWGIGLYVDLYRYWFVTPVDRALRPGDVHAVHRDGLPTVGPATLVWVGFNPSRSDDERGNRVTLRRVLRIAERERLTEVLGLNLYGYRDTDPNEISRRARHGCSLVEIIGAGNDEILHHAANSGAGHTILAWGGDGEWAGRGAEVARWFPDGQCLGICKNREPRHPARLPDPLLPRPFR